MKKLVMTLLLVALLTAGAHAQELTDHDYFSAAELDAFAEALAADASAGPGRIVDQSNYFAAISHRQPGPGMSESHRDWADLYFVSSGTGTLVVGGAIRGGRETGPGEIRGTSIEGGIRRMLAEGDVVHIPAGTPHHVIVAAGEQLTYVLFKVRAEP